MYKLLKNYKNLANQNVLGKTSEIERFEKQMLLIKFYDENATAAIDNFSIYQQYFILKSFLQENLIPSNILEKKILNKALAYKHGYLLNESFLFHINSEHKIDMYLEDWKASLNFLLLNLYFKKYKKIFNNLEKEKKYILLKKIKQFFFNRNLTKYIYIFKLGSTKKKTLLLKFYRKCLFFFFFRKFQKTIFKKKRIILPLNFSFYNMRGLYFTIPGIKNSFFVPYSNLQRIVRNFSSNKMQRNLIRKLNIFLPLDINSFMKKRFLITLHIWKKNVFLKQNLRFRKK